MRTVYIIFLLSVFASTSTSAQSIFSAQASAIPVNATSVEWGDFDVDGDQDALVLNSNVLSIYVNNLSGTTATFTTFGGTIPVGTCVQADWIDINNDGYLDIFVNTAGSGRFLISAKAVLFTYNGETLPFTSITDWGDVDSDGDLDILTGNRIAENKGNLIFELRTTLPEPGEKFIDFDDDGDLDVLAGGKIYSNLGGYVFTLFKYFYQDIENSGTSDLLSKGSTVSDIDGDGKLEFLGTIDYITGYPNFDCQSRFMINSTQSPGPAGSYNPFDGCSSVRLLGAADFDNNGSVDLLSWDGGSAFFATPASLQLFSKDGTGNYVFKSALTFSLYDNFRAVDFNNDKKLDFSIGGHLFINSVSVAGTAPSPPQSLEHTITGDASVSLSWSLGADNNTAAKSLSYNLMVTRGPVPFFNEQISADFKTVVTGDGNVGRVLKYSLNGLPNGTYQWKVQSVDHGLMPSAFSAVATFEITNNYDPVSSMQLVENFKTVYNETNNQYLATSLTAGHVFGEFIDGNSMQPSGNRMMFNIVNGNADDFNVGYNNVANKYFVVWSVGNKLYGNTLTPSNFTGVGTETLLYTAAPLNDIELVGENIPFNSTDGVNGVFWIERRVDQLKYKFLNLSFTTTLQAGAIKDVISRAVTPTIPDAGQASSLVLGSDIQYISKNKSYALASSYSGQFSAPCGVCFPSYLRGGYLIDIVDRNGVWIRNEKIATDAVFNPRLQYNPYNNNFFASWNALEIVSTNSGRNSHETSDIKTVQFKFLDNGTLSVAPVANMADLSSGTPNLLVANPHVAWTSKRNEFMLSFNTTDGVMYFQRFSPFDGSMLEPYQTTVTPEAGSSPKLFANSTSGEFLLGWWVDTNQGRFKKFKIEKDAGPAISSIAPTSAYPGDTVLIRGSNFGRMPFTNKVKFGTIEANVDTVYFKTTMLRVVVPAGLSRQPVPITLTFDDQDATSTTLFENLTLQSVTAIDVTVGVRGDLVTIKGDRFATDPTQIQVKIGGTTAELTDIVNLTTTEIKVKIPQGALRGKWPVAVVIQGQQVRAEDSLRVIVPPVITSVTASGGFISCNTVTINGTDFSTVIDSLIIKFGDRPALKADVVAAFPTTILVKVPLGAEGLAPITVEIDSRIASSDPVNVQLGSSISPTSPVPPTAITLSNRTDDGVDVQLRILNQCSAKSAKLFTKGISEGNGSWTSTNLTLESNRADARLTEAQFSDPIGLNVMFEIEDSERKIYSDTFFIHKNYTELDSTNNVPGLAFGGNASDYNIISIPYQLTPNNIPSVFKDLVNKFGSDSSKWRLFHYLNTGSNGHYIENTRGLDKIEPGKGYWMIVRYPQEIFIDGAQAVDLTNGPFEITLQPGWNQVGNPYNFTITWADVLAFNKNPADLESLKTFANGAFQPGSKLEAFRGGFVRYNGATPLVLKIPFTKDGSGGRQAGTTRSSVLTDRQWYIPLTLSGNTLTNETLGIGMDPNAQTGYDAMDESRMPAFYNQLDVAFDGNLASSVVPTDGQFTWAFSVHNATTGSKLSFTWDNTSFGDGDRNLYLYDIANERVIDMRTTNTYSFSYPASTEFKLFYGDQAYIDEKLVPEHVLLGEAYPNPMTSATRTNIPFTVVENDTHVKLTIYNVNGQPVATLHDKPLSRGFYEISWDGNDGSGRAVSAGMYIYRLESSTKNKVATQSRKLVSH